MVVTDTLPIPDDVRYQAARITERVTEKGAMTRRQITNGMFKKESRGLVKPGG